MVHRIYVEKRTGFRLEASELLHELRQYLGLTRLSEVRIIHRYDVEGITKEEFQEAVLTVFSEPQADETMESLSLPIYVRMFALEALPGQFDQRADSAAQCIQLMTRRERPTVRYAKVFVLKGEITGAQVEAIKKYVLNPVEAREASLALPETLKVPVALPEPIAEISGFCSMDSKSLLSLKQEMGLAMDGDDLNFVQAYFQGIQRNPTHTELRVMDTYWSDHCRHTTFLTELEDPLIADPTIAKTYRSYLKLKQGLGKNTPPTLMELATIAAKSLKTSGGLPHLDESEEINACTLRIQADTPEGQIPYLLLFKNETHNHPTEIEPFGGAATCIGGAIRDPLSARSYVYASMRVTGAGDPTAPLENTLPGKLPQRKICTLSAAGFSSYGNQIGLATGCVHEFYHPGYVAKRLETGAVLGAAPAAHVRRERPIPGDIVILLGGKTGRDGVGGATGSSKAHTLQSVDTCGAEVQKGNAPEERKLQRLFLNPRATRLIKRCNDFGAGGVSVAIGELADGLDIDLGKVPLKYEGLSATEIAISESQERMAVVVASQDSEAFLALAKEENLEAMPVAVVTDTNHLVMRWQGEVAVNLDRSFLDSNGAKKKAAAEIVAPENWQKPAVPCVFDALKAHLSSLNGCSRRGLSERFDSTIGANTVLFPFGGKAMRTPPCAMVHTLPIHGGTSTVSMMAYGFNPEISEKSPYHGAYLAVVESVTNLIASGAPFEHVYLSFQEFFPKPGNDPKRWGLPLAALLGALRAQTELGIAAIGGKDSMSGSFEKMDVPPTLISFAVAWGDIGLVHSPEFKQAGSRLMALSPVYDQEGLPRASSLKEVYAQAHELMKAQRVLSACAVTGGGMAEAVFRMASGNHIGLTFDQNVDEASLHQYAYGTLLLEMADEEDCPGVLLGRTGGPSLVLGSDVLPITELLAPYEEKLEKVYPTTTFTPEIPLASYHFKTQRKKGPTIARPRVLIPAFPGTNCEIDTAQAFERAGAIPEILVLRNLSAADTEESVRQMVRMLHNAQILLIPGGFSGGDEPEGSAKLITAFLRSAPVREAILDLLHHRKGLVGGICNGFQALIKLGLVPFGDYTPITKDSPTLTYNLLGRHQSRMVRVKVASNLSPWFLENEPGEVVPVPISHGEGRLSCSSALIESLAAKGQIATQYVDRQGRPSMDIEFNPNGSMGAIEALTSPDGLVMGRMGHSERMLSHLYRNLPGIKEDPLFRSAVRYYE